MNWFCWLVVVVPLIFVCGMAVYSRKYIRGVADFLVAGRVAGRYVISVAEMTDALSVFSLVAMCEMNYQTGFAMDYWYNILLPVSVFLGLTGWITYRFRETCSMSGGQFLEIRYSRNFRIFATSIRVFAETLTNCIGPAVAARFFIYLLGIPLYIPIFGIQVSSFVLLLVCCLTLALGIILAGGRISLIVTDCLQGLISYPIFVILAVFVFTNYSWFHEIAPIMGDRVSGESFLNPYDVQNLRDFNLFALIVLLLKRFIGGIWLGNDSSGAGRTPHEQKMAGILGTWRGGFSYVMCLLLVVVVITVMNHQNYADRAHSIRLALTHQVCGEVVPSAALQSRVDAAVKNVKPVPHVIGKSAPLSRRENLDTPYLDEVHRTLCAGMATPEEGNQLFQNFRSMYNQMMLPVTMRHIFPPLLLALFILLAVMLMLSTDDSRIFNSASTLIQDLVVPLCRKPLTPEAHVRLLKWMTVAVTLVFFWGSFFLSQLDFLNLFVTITISIWSAGAGAVVTFGLYSRRGTTWGAYAALIAGGGISVGGMLIQRNWAETIYPMLESRNMVDEIGNWLTTLSTPFNPWIVWSMNPVKCPVNSVEISFIAFLSGVAAYWIVSLLTCREPFNLDRMLHRGIYNLNPEKKAIRQKFTWRKLLNYLVSITPDYSTGDKVIAWSIFFYSIVYKFFLMFIVVIFWNLAAPLTKNLWGHYFFVNSLLVPSIAGVVTTVWFTWGGIVDLRRLFRDLAARRENPLDNGYVEGHVSLSDRAEFEKREQERSRRK